MKKKPEHTIYIWYMFFTVLKHFECLGCFLSTILFTPLYIIILIINNG